MTMPYDKYKTTSPNDVPLKLIEVGMNVLLKKSMPYEGFRTKQERIWIDKHRDEISTVTYKSVGDSFFQLDKYLYCSDTNLIEDIIEGE